GGYGTPLQAASAKGHLAIVEKLLADEKYKEGLNRVEGRYGTALCAACANEQVEVVKVLLQAGALLNVNDLHFGTPLHVTVLMGSELIVNMLLD
ncbi:ankyrin repeat-containing domain protein, partial [Mycena rosella]